MIHNKYFSDAFILHDRTNFYPFLEKVFLPVRENKIEMDYPIELNNMKLKDSNLKNKTKFSGDYRKFLNEQWASPCSFYKFQPIDLVRLYFGESFALYFGWLGIFNLTLILPVVVGVAFFAIGLINR